MFLLFLKKIQGDKQHFETMFSHFLPHKHVLANSIHISHMEALVFFKLFIFILLLSSNNFPQKWSCNISDLSSSFILVYLKSQKQGGPGIRNEVCFENYYNKFFLKKSVNFKNVIFQIN